MRKRITLALIALGCATCAPKPPPEPARPDWTAQQERIWSLAPADTAGGLTIANAGHAIDKLASLRALVASGKAGKRLVDRWVPRLTEALTFDPFDRAAWQAHGVALDGPMGFFYLRGARAMIAFKVADEALARRSFTQKLACVRTGDFLACGDEPVPLAASPSASIWARVKQEVPKDQLAAEALFFLPLERFAEESFGSEPALRFLAGSRAASASLDLGDDRVRVGLGFKHPDVGRLGKYLAAEPDAQRLLGTLAGARSALRFNFSPRALWALAKSEIPADRIGQASGVFQLATGLDLEKDVIENITGEIVAGAFDQGGLVEVFGTRDDARTKRLAERLDSLAWGALASVKSDLEAKGWKVEHRQETAGGRPAYVLSFDIPKDLAPEQGHAEVHLATCRGEAGAGGILLAFDRRGRDAAVEGVKRPAAATLNALPAYARRALTTPSVAAMWGETYDERTLRRYMQVTSVGQKDLLEKTYGAIDPDLPAFVSEAVELGAFVYDTVGTVELGEGRADLRLDVNLL